MSAREDMEVQIARIIIADAKASPGGMITSKSALFCAHEILDHIRDNPEAMKAALMEMAA